MRSIRRAVIAAAFTLVAVAHAAAEEIPREQLELAREVVELSGARENGRRLLDHLRSGFVSQVRQSYAEEDAERIWQYFVEEFEAGLPALVDQVAEEYARLLNKEQLEALRAFYSSAAGRALVSHQVEFILAGQRAGAALGVQAGMRAEQRLLEEQRGRRGPT